MKKKNQIMDESPLDSASQAADEIHNTCAINLNKAIHDAFETANYLSLIYDYNEILNEELLKIWIFFGLFGGHMSCSVSMGLGRD